MSTQESKVTPNQDDALEAGRYFRFMADFVGFTQAEADTIRETRFIIEKFIPEIVGDFYNHLLYYPPTRKFFQKKDGSIDKEYLELRMHHLTKFLRRTAQGVYDNEYARYVAYVGLTHTTHGADPKIYIPERYVIGQVGFVQHAISEMLTQELHEIDPELERRAQKAWNLLLMVILEMLARAYSEERDVEAHGTAPLVNQEAVSQLAVDTYERSLGIGRVEKVDLVVAKSDEIPPGERKILQAGDISLGVFHHKGCYYAVRNYCLHRGGPIATGKLEDGILTCPWHGYQYDLTTGELLSDPSIKLDMYEVEMQDGELHIEIPTFIEEEYEFGVEDEPDSLITKELKENEFLVSELAPGQVKLVHVNGERVAVYNAAGEFYATQDACTHADGPLSEGQLDGTSIICPWHDSCFNITDGSVLRGPAREPLRKYQVKVSGAIGRVE